MASSNSSQWLYVPDYQRMLLAEDLMEASCASEALKSGVYGVGFGALMAAGSGWWTGLPFRESLPMMGRMGGVVGSIGALTYGTVCISAQVREKDDYINTGVGGFVAGALIGIRAQSLRSVCFYAPMVAAGLAAIDFTGRNMREQESKPYEDKIKRAPFLQWPKRDPFAERWKEIQAREAAKSE
ncbi:hypothetical protein SmJEL517_g02816 [Synchytrium microbalum]|uniref:Uncharacterized protein n=1 Tax=Synchytrium microbalum TaxID=1806994 RepID=A0A507C9B3_9FUNG|nr:uncharacterized protein SmJEL517_g02816 [Synchytrium microbalum]TPX34564.1 hypothetical protein SmJEL517_g02816 [Synchytrium microbalum]